MNVLRGQLHVAVSFVALLVLVPLVVTATAAPAAPSARDALVVRSIWTSEFGVPHPGGIAYLAGEKALLVTTKKGQDTHVLRLSGFEQQLGDADLPSVPDTANVAVDPASGTFYALSGGDEVMTTPNTEVRTKPRPTTGRHKVAGLGLRNARGVAFDSQGTMFILDRAARTLIRVPRVGGSFGKPTRFALDIGASDLRGLAFNPADGNLYTASPANSTLYELDKTGNQVTTVTLKDTGIRDLRGLVFAPSPDPTDAPATQHLFVADAGSAPALGARPGATPTLGGVTEITLAPLAAAVVTPQSATLVRTILTSQFNPPSPDPAGVAYFPGSDSLFVSDSEVDEMTIYQGKNLFRSTRTGTLLASGVTTAYSKEPTGVSYDPVGNRLFVSDDNKAMVFTVLSGGDGVFGTSDDTRTSFGVTALGVSDCEGVAYDTTNGHLFISDGVGLEVWEINPVNGTFGDGNDVVTHFDLGQFGVRDAEGIAVDNRRGTVAVVDPSSGKLYEMTKTGTLVAILDMRGFPYTAKSFADVVLAPSSSTSDAPDVMNYYVPDRAVDNGQNPNENDGRIFEVVAPPSTTSDAPPTASVTQPAEGSTVSGTVSVQATAGDDHGVTQVQFFVDGSSIGTDTNGANGWSASWNTTLAANGPHTVSATATDTASQTGSDSNAVTVSNVAADAPPTASVTQPAEGSTVSGTVSVQATAGDDHGVTQVQFFVDGSSIGTDTNGANGWSASWNTTLAANGPHTVSATATDTASQTGSDSNAVTVSNVAADAPPTASVTQPAEGSTVSGTVSVQATAGDDHGVTQVQFFVDGSSIGTDTNGANGWSASWNTTLAANGPHTVSATATDTASQTGSDSNGVTVSNGGGGGSFTLDVAVTTGAADVEQLPGAKTSFGSDDLDLVIDKGTTPQYVGLRFTGVTVPKNATITNAYVQFRADSATSGATSLNFRAEASDNAPAFTTAVNNVSSRTLGSASTSWSPVAWMIVGELGAKQRTPSLNAVLQELVNRAGWASGNAVVLVVTGSGKRAADSFEGGYGSVLHIEFTTP